MDQHELWSGYSSFIIGKAKEFHKKFPEVLELEEKISVAWLCAEQARQQYSPEKGAFKTYAGASITHGLFREINKEIGAHKVKNSEFKVVAEIYSAPSEDMDLHRTNTLPLDEQLSIFNHITSVKGGFCYWLKAVYGLSLSRIAELTGYSRPSIVKQIKHFLDQY